MENELNHENLSDEISSQVENNTETNFIASTLPSSSSREDESTAVQCLTGSTFYVPFCGAVFCVMAASGFICMHSMRVSLSVALVAMINQTTIVTDDDVTINITNISNTDQCPRDPALQRADGEFTWDRHQQGALLAAFFYGTLITQIPAGWLADRYGGKRLFGGSILISSVISLLTPVAARAHFGVLLLLRVLVGLCEGFLFPAVHALIARWSAPKYRSTVATLIFAGTPLGVVVGMLLSGVLCDHGFAGGWPSVFYVFGMVGCVWSAAWFLLCYDSPATHLLISTTEREYWERMIGIAELVARPPTPWRKILTSLPVWALAIAFFAHNWGVNMLMTWAPVFMHDVLGFNMTNNGVFSAVPFLAMVSMVPLGWFADWLRSPGRLSTNVVRKIFCATGFILAACMLILVGYIGCNRALAVSLMFLFILCISMATSVVLVNQLDLAPLHAGKIMGLTKFVGIVASIVAPQVVGALTYHSSTRYEWQKVFFLAAGVQVLGAIVFVVFGSGNLQSWAGLTGAETNEQQQSNDVDNQQSEM